jgi:plastocyanin
MPMAARRVVTLFVLVALTIVLVACGSDDNGDDAATGNGDGGNGASAPVDLGTVNDQGNEDLGSSVQAALALEANDNSFSPTFVKAAPGATVTVDITNVGSASHTFTVNGTSIDEELEAGASSQAEVTVPANGALEFVCRFHGAAGMKGAFYTNDGDAVTNAAGSGTDPDTSTTAAGGLYR